MGNTIPKVLDLCEDCTKLLDNAVNAGPGRITCLGLAPPPDGVPAEDRIRYCVATPWKGLVRTFVHEGDLEQDAGIMIAARLMAEPSKSAREVLLRVMRAARVYAKTAQQGELVVQLDILRESLRGIIDEA